MADYSGFMPVTPKSSAAFPEGHSLVTHLRTYWGLWLIAILPLFLFPLRLGVKFDVAMYGGTARTILETGSWWPLRMHQDFLDPFYLQPPLGVWGMAVTATLFGGTPWSYQLFSRLCAVLTYGLMGLAVLRLARVDRPAAKNTESYVTLFLLLLPTWGIWVKYAGDGQLDGPLGFGIAGTVAAAAFAMFPLPGEQRRLPLVWLFVFSFIAFLMKALFFLPVVLALFLWGLVCRKGKVFGAALVSAAGAAFALGFLVALDKWFGTQWWQGYFAGQISKHVTETDAGLVSLQRAAELLFKVLEWYPLEMRFSPLWTAVLLLLLGVAAVRRTLFKSRPACFLTLIYFCYMAPVFVAKMKMPHWTVAIYPVAAVLLTLLIPASVRNAIAAKLTATRVNRAAVVLFVLAAILPYQREIPEYRGQDWLAMAPVIQQSATSDLPFLFIVKPERFDPWGHYSYAAFALGRKTPMRFARAEVLLAAPCRGGLLGIDSFHSTFILADITAKGWRRLPGPARNLFLFECVR